MVFYSTIIKTAGRIFTKMMTKPIFGFQSFHYQQHNQRRLEHLASLGLNLSNKTVLEVGAGIGDHTSFFLDRGSVVTITDARKENLDLLRRRYPGKEIYPLDLDAPSDMFGDRSFDIVYCYGLLYHLKNPQQALSYMAAHCRGLLLLETCVSFVDNGQINLVAEDAGQVTQAYTGIGCRPARSWVFNCLKELFPFVYMPASQPWHPEFPTDWATASSADQNLLTRAVFVASKHKLDNAFLLDAIPEKQVHEFDLLKNKSI